MLNPFRAALYSLAIPLVYPLVAAVPGGWFVAILGIGFLIFIHEWGHYIACVLTGTRTETFSVGFGPRLLGWERDRNGKRRFTIGRRQLDPDDHAMDFRIALIPLGGYVKMAGGEIIGESQSDDPEMFVNKSAWARIFIVSAGVIMNIITAIAFYSLSYASGKEQEPNYVGMVAPGGPAWSAGLEPGDKVTAINGAPVKSFYDMRMEVVFLDDEERATFTVEREGEEIEVKVLPKYGEERGHVSIQVLPGRRLTIGEGDGAIEVGFDENATVADIPVRGGSETLAILDNALQAGETNVTITDSAGGTVAVDVNALDKGAKPDVEPTPKIGLQPYAYARVIEMSGDLENDVIPGDVLLAAITESGERIEIHSVGARVGLPYHAPIRELVVRRGEEERRVTPTLATRADVQRWLDRRAFEQKSTNKVVPIPAGHQMLMAGHVFRYPSSPALQAGVQAGDKVLKIGESTIKSFDDLIAAIGGSEPGAPLELEIEDPEGARRTVTVEPVTLEHLGEVKLAEVLREPLDVGLGEAFAMGFRNTWREVGNVFRTIGVLFTGRLAFQKNIAGPVRLVQFSKSQADRGPAELLWFLAYVSVMLAVLNILPIPVLDGGHLLFIIIEKIKGSPLKEATVAKAMYIGLFLVLTLMFFAFKSDFHHLFPG